MSSSIGKNRPTFIVNSKDRSSGTTEDFFYRLPLSKNDGFDAVSISSIQIPKTFYTLSEGRDGDDNTFVLSELGLDITITIPEGNYNVFNFPIVLKQNLDAASFLLGHSWRYIITYPDRLTETDTQKFTFEVLGSGGNFPTFTLSDNRIREMMGLDCESGCTFSVIAGKIKLISEYAVNFQWTQYITVKSSIANNAGNESQDNAILAVIPVTTVPDGSMIIYDLKNLEDQTKQLANQNGNLYSFSLYDDHDRRINLRGPDWMIQLFVYKQNNYYELAINSLRLKQLDIITQTEKKKTIEEKTKELIDKQLEK